MIRIILTTFPDEETAERISKLLVERGLAACATLLPGARSIYRWENEIQNENEIIVLFKTTVDTYDLLLSEISNNHPYEIPELITLDASQVSPDYLTWATSQCQPPRP